jgi:hypothetical protein
MKYVTETEITFYLSKGKQELYTLTHMGLGERETEKESEKQREKRQIHTERRYTHTQTHTHNLVNQNFFKFYQFDGTKCGT